MKTAIQTRLSKLEKTILSTIKKDKIYYKQDRENKKIEILQFTDNGDMLTIYWQINQPSIALTQEIEAKYKCDPARNYDDHNPSAKDTDPKLFATAKELKKAIANVKYASAKDSKYRQLNGLALAATIQTNNLGGAIATDGHRLAIYGEHLETDTDRYFLIPLPVVRTIEKLLETLPDGEIRLDNSDRITKIKLADEFCIPRVTLSYSRIKSEYPNCLSLIPPTKNFDCFKFDCNETIETIINEINNLKDYDRSVFLNFQNGCLEIQTDNKYPRQIIRKPIISGQKLEIEIMVSGALLQEVLLHANEDTQIYIGNYGEPILIINDRDRHLLMPQIPKLR